MGIVENAKEVADLIQKYNDIELNRKIIELEGQIIELTRENLTLTQKVDELNKALNVSKAMLYIEPFYYMDGKEDKYCPNCWDVNKKVVRIFRLPVGASPKGRGGNYFHECPNCKVLYP